METANHLEQLSRVAQTLNQQTDTYTESLTRLEKKLRQMNLGVEAWVRVKESGMSGTPQRDASVVTMLGYAKTSNGWGFALRDDRIERGFWEDDPDCPWENQYEGEAKPLLKASRDLRILAAPCIGNLLRALGDEANESLRALQKAQNLAEQI